jgi:hypothetical protein
MTKLSPAEVADKHARRLKAATEDIRIGVERVTEAPGAKAAAKAEKMKQNLVASIDSGKWQKRVSSVTLDEWKSKMIGKGLGRISSGVDAAIEKTTEFHSQLQSHQAGIDSQLGKMPDLTLEDNIQRMVHQVRGMKKFKRE